MEQDGGQMLRQFGWPLRFLTSWLGGWKYVLLLVLLGSIALGGFIVEQRRHPPLPPQAYRVDEQLIPGAFRRANNGPTKCWATFRVYDARPGIGMAGVNDAYVATSSASTSSAYGSCMRSDVSKPRSTS